MTNRKINEYLPPKRTNRKIRWIQGLTNEIIRGDWPPVKFNEKIIRLKRISLSTTINMKIRMGLIN